MKRPRIRARSASGGQTPAEDSRLKNRTRTIPTISFEKYCGKTYGVRDLSVGFLGGFAGGLATGFLLFGHPVPELVLAVLFGWYFRGAWVRHKVEKRKRDFLDQFCDYLDSIATSLAVGRNGYESFLTADEDAVMMNLYASGTASVVWPKTGEKISLETYTLYPKMDTVSIRYREREPKRFKLKLRIPSWSAATGVTVKSVGGSPQAVAGAKAGSYLAIDREWKCGDQIDIRFDFTPVGHRLNGCAAFTVGPLLLARDARFGRGDISEVLARWANVDKPQIFRTRTQDDCFYATFIGLFMTGVHTKNAGERYPSVIDFCDYASAGNTWGDDSSFRVWLPIEKTPESL